MNIQHFFDSISNDLYYIDESPVEEFNFHKVKLTDFYNLIKIKKN